MFFIDAELEYIYSDFKPIYYNGEWLLTESVDLDQEMVIDVFCGEHNKTSSTQGFFKSDWEYIDVE